MILLLVCLGGRCAVLRRKQGMSGGRDLEIAQTDKGEMLAANDLMHAYPKLDQIRTCNGNIKWKQLRP